MMEKEKETMKLRQQFAGLLMTLLMLTILLPAGVFAEDGMNPNEMSEIGYRLYFRDLAGTGQPI